jgi:PD-(D/E)XK nuclease superfamily
MLDPLYPEDEVDAAFLLGLIAKRGQAREHHVYAPSLLAGCVRRLFFERTGKDRGSAKSITQQSSNAFFYDGNWRHWKWQFALFKLHRNPDIEFHLHGVEVRVHNAKGDVSGTLDAICNIGDETFIVDIKGMRGFYFNQFAEGKEHFQYELQLSTYGYLLRDTKKSLRSSRGIILAEHKEGLSTADHPIGLHERVIEFKDYFPFIRLRLDELREYEKANTIPPPACKTTTESQFVQCPYRKYCRDEIASDGKFD